MQSQIDQRLRHATCTVLGASGFIGSNLCLALRERAAVVRGFARRSIPVWLEGIEWHQGEFADADAVARAVRGSDVVFHLVSATVPGSMDPAFDLRANVLPTVTLLQLCKEAGVKRVVFISSGGTVYGRAQTVPTPESAPTNPICSYGVGKLACEKYLLLFHHLYGLGCRIVRASNAYGPYQSAEQQGVVGVFLRRALAGQPVSLWGDGSTVRDYVYVADLVEALVRAAHQEEGPLICNIGSGRGMSILEVADAVEAALGRSLVRLQSPGRNVDVPINVLDISVAKALGWAPRTDFAVGLANTIDWLKSAPDHLVRAR
jgi:UDP-glucose 4-epimerase